MSVRSPRVCQRWRTGLAAIVVAASAPGCGYDPAAVTPAPVGEAPVATAALAFDAYLQGRERGDWSAFLALVSDGVELELPGEASVLGRRAVAERLAALVEELSAGGPPRRLIVESVEAEGETTFLYRCRQRARSAEADGSRSLVVLEVCQEKLCALRQSRLPPAGRVGSPSVDGESLPSAK